ncbi:MAG TPA: exosortase/archaeosortase family protein [Gemmatimonadales bacterium]|nr:exosortase/archaeosortase family protein [Gemmatimonadales bacterium]
MAVSAEPIMTAGTLRGRARAIAPRAFAGVAFVLLFAEPFALLARDWWSDPDAGHGLLLAPLAAWLAWRAGLRRDTTPQPVPGLAILGGAVVLRYLAGLAAELFTMRFAMLLALVGLLVHARGFRQALHWWLPFTLLALSIPLPDVLTNALAMPLQLKASAWGAALLDFRHVPVQLLGNVIRLPGRELFVTEACSGLRSLTALLSLGVLVGGFWLRHPASRGLLIAAAIPVAMAVNAVRVFLTGFLVYYISPEMGEGFMHMSEGWLLFVVAFVVLGLITVAVGAAERRLLGARRAHA